jgi:hypothetical protein
LRLRSRIWSSFKWRSVLTANVIITWRANVETSILIWNEIIKVEEINQIETIATTNEEKETIKTLTTIMTTTIATTTTKTSRNFTNCTSSWSSKRCRQWASCSLKSFFEFWITHVLNTTFEKNRRSSRTRSSTNQFQLAILRNQFTSWNKKRFVWFAKSTTNKWTFFFRRFLRFEMFFEFNQFWSIKRNSLFHVVQIEFVYDQRSRHHNKKARQQRVFFELWKHVNYNFIITFIVDNLVETFVKDSAINKKILNIWHARLKHLREQNLRRLAKMSNKMNLIKSVANKNFCKSCIVIKQKVESHNNFVILDKHSLNLMWSDLVQSFVFKDKIKYFVIFLYDFIKRSMIYVLRVKFNTFDAFRHFQQHNERENNRVCRLRIDWERKYFNDEFDNHRFEHEIEWKSIMLKISKQNEVIERLKQIFMLMINIMLKNVDLNDK